MPTIIAICPYCRAGGVRAPDSAVGASATCPKCRSSFTVIPCDDIPPDWDKPIEKPGRVPESSPLEETRAAAAMPDVTEPSPVLPAEPAAPRVAKPPRAAAMASPSEGEEATATPADPGMVFALAALILVGPAVLVSQLPYGRLIALPLAGVGLIGGLLCLGAERRARLAAGVGAGLHFLLLVVLLFLPSWLNLDPWSGPAAAEEPKGPLMVEHGSGLTAPLPEGEWLDAARYSWQLRDARVTARGAAVGPVELHGPKGARRLTREPYLHLVLQVRNAGHEREIPLSGWAAGQGADGVLVSDASGKALAPASFENGWAPERGKPAPRAMPGHTSEVVLFFAAPPVKSDSVRVQLPGAALGASDDIRFRAVFTVHPARGPGK